MIHAYSRQAKGRIERLFRTFQDRLVKEMRLAGLETLEEANTFLEGSLPVYNHLKPDILICYQQFDTGSFTIILIML